MKPYLTLEHVLESTEAGMQAIQARKFQYGDYSPGSSIKAAMAAAGPEYGLSDQQKAGVSRLVRKAEIGRDRGGTRSPSKPLRPGHLQRITGRNPETRLPVGQQPAPKPSSVKTTVSTEKPKSKARRRTADIAIY
jgi:hypothetical protein